jgi:hypothetical protein
LGLVAYPILVEPLVPAQTQLLIWSGAYVVFAAVSIGAALWLMRSAPASPVTAREPSAVPWDVRLYWFLLPACASAMLIGVTSHLTQNVAPVPLLWILPLALYLATFAICFERDRWYDAHMFRLLLAAGLYLIGYGILKQGSRISHRVAMTVICVAFFLCCMYCHGELARLKPSAGRLTSYYMTLSFGGAFGGIFASLLAPNIFSGYYELPVMVVACGLLAIMLFRREGNRIWIFWVVYTFMLALMLGVGLWQLGTGNQMMGRNFYGMVRVVNDGSVRKLLHGMVNHGEQFLDPAREREPTTYFTRNSGVGLALRFACPESCRVGVIGLGAGTLAAYARPNDTYRFYEINPMVIDIARNHFRFLAQSPGKVEIVEGDARLSMEKEKTNPYDVLIVDAFSGDSIPVHLLTREAAKLYLQHLKPAGVLAVHVTNTYLDLAPLVGAVFSGMGVEMRHFSNDLDAAARSFPADWILLMRNSEFLSRGGVTAGRPVRLRPGLRAWTDDYSNLLQLLY